MGELASIKRTIYGKNSFTTVVDTNFSQLIKVEDSGSSDLNTQISDFFSQYDSLFFQIPVSGSSNSHQELVERSSAYLGLSYSSLLESLNAAKEEINQLKNSIS